jgi:helix-turn-helix protein
MVAARAWSARAKRDRQHKGPLTRAFLEVLQALLWSFHNAKDGRCYPSYEAIAAKAGCARSIVAEALKILEWAGILTWQNRIIRVRDRCIDLFGQQAWQWRIVRTSNAYVFRDPAAKSENQVRTRNQDLSNSVPAPTRHPESPLERALIRFAEAVARRNGLEQAGG